MGSEGLACVGAEAAQCESGGDICPLSETQDSDGPVMTRPRHGSGPRGFQVVRGQDRRRFRIREDDNSPDPAELVKTGKCCECARPRFAPAVRARAYTCGLQDSSRAAATRIYD